MGTALSDAALERHLMELSHWSYDRERRALFRRLEFDAFPQAFAVMMRIAFEAEKADHHPEWLNVWNRVDIWLTTHDAGGVSERDVEMARRIDLLVGEHDCR